MPKKPRSECAQSTHSTAGRRGQHQTTRVFSSKPIQKEKRRAFLGLIDSSGEEGDYSTGKKSAHTQSAKGEMSAKSSEPVDSSHVCKLSDLIQLLEMVSGLDLQAMEVGDAESIQVRNEQLFPYLKSHTVILSPQDTLMSAAENAQAGQTVCLTFRNAPTFISLLTKVVPELASCLPTPQQALSSFLTQRISWWEPSSDGTEAPLTALIRKKDFKMYKYDVRCKNLDKVFSRCPNDYLDPLDREMLIQRHKQMNVTTRPAIKWLNMCWDSFRHVDNHNKSHIFHVKIPRADSEVSGDKSLICIETVREKLLTNQFRSIEEFSNEMQALFAAWQQANTRQHKFFKTFQSIQERFTKQMVKAKQRVQEASIKQETRQMLKQRSQQSYPDYQSSSMEEVGGGFGAQTLRILEDESSGGVAPATTS